MPLGKIGYVTIGSAADVRAWSGLNSYILKALRDAGLDMAVADNLQPAKQLWPRSKAQLYRRILGKTYHLDRDRRVARRWADEAATKLAAQGQIKTVVSTGSIPVAQLPQSYRVVIWADATFHSLRSIYPSFENLCSESIRSGEWIEKTAFDRASLLCFSSDWAASDAANHYCVPDNKLAVIPYGANCPPAYRDRAAAASQVRLRSKAICRLVFVGVDWQRKGGPIALQIADHLNALGIPVILSLVGGAPPADTILPPYVEYRGFLNKQLPNDWRQWDELMRTAHCMILPSTADCTPIVFAEASAYAVPTLATDVGGVATVVKQGINGLLFQPQIDAESYGSAIAGLWRNAQVYEAMCMACYEEWQQRLNWTVSGRKFSDLLSQFHH